MRRGAAIIMIVIALAFAQPAAAQPLWGASPWGFLGRLATWVVSIFEKAGSQQDPWGRPAEGDSQSGGALRGHEVDG